MERLRTHPSSLAFILLLSLQSVAEPFLSGDLGIIPTNEAVSLSFDFAQSIGIRIKEWTDTNQVTTGKTRLILKTLSATELNHTAERTKFDQWILKLRQALRSEKPSLPAPVAQALHSPNFKPQHYLALPLESLYLLEAAIALRNSDKRSADRAIRMAIRANPNSSPPFASVLDLADEWDPQVERLEFHYRNIRKNEKISIRTESKIVPIIDQPDTKAISHLMESERLNNILCFHVAEGKIQLFAITAQAQVTPISTPISVKDVLSQSKQWQLSLSPDILRNGLAVTGLSSLMLDEVIPKNPVIPLAAPDNPGEKWYNDWKLWTALGTVLGIVIVSTVSQRAKSAPITQVQID